MNYKVLFFTAVLLAGLPAICLASRDSIAFVDSVRGEAAIESAGRSIPAVANMKLFTGDLVRTGTKGSVGLIFDDDSVVAIGPESELQVEEFLFHPAEEELSFVAKMFKGTFSFITGQIAKLAPEKVRLETPEATLGVRGTKFAVEIK
ncbi:MAG TPA: FecR domain-containing protein [Desulfopila sp.]|nr:FecR domain-containing protein [Desulfopila sp.]